MEELTARLTAVLLVSLRIAPVLAFGGPFAMLRIPVTIRVLIALSLALWLVAGRPEATTQRVLAGYSVPGLAVGEMFVGLTVSLSLQLAYAAILWAGRIIDVQAGFGLAMIADPTTQAQMPLVGTVFAYAAAMIFFATGGAHDLLALWAATLDFMPLGHGFYTGDMRALFGLAAALFGMGIGLVGLILLVLFLLDLVIAFMSRTLPQMNVLLLGFQIKSLAVLVTLPLALSLSAGLLLRMLRLSLEAVPRLLGQGGA